MTAKTLFTPTPAGRRGRLLLGSLLLALHVAACAPTAQSSSPASPQAPATPPPSEAMMPSEAMGLWQSSFGAVKIEPDAASGQGHVMGVWLYEREGQEVLGFFTGELRGNVLEFSWHEPAQPEDLTGAGYLVFEPAGGRFTGKWWSQDRTRTGDWTGWRAPAPEGSNPAQGSGADPNS